MCVAWDVGLDDGVASPVALGSGSLVGVSVELCKVTVGVGRRILWHAVRNAAEVNPANRTNSRRDNLLFIGYSLLHQSADCDGRNCMVKIGLKTSLSLTLEVSSKSRAKL